MAAIEREDLTLAGDISETWNPLRLQEGLAIVAQVLLAEIRHHAQERSCGCGSLEWIDRMGAEGGSPIHD